MAFENIKSFISEQFSEFEYVDLDPRKEWSSAWNNFFAWAVPSFLFVLWVAVERPENQYYNEAIKQAIGPNLWNVVGIFGLFSFGLAVTFSKFDFISTTASRVLMSTYSIGSLTLGILLGQWFLIIDKNELVWWQIGIFGVTSVFLLAIVFIFNFFIWYLRFLLINNGGQKSIIRTKLEKMHPLWGISIGTVIVALSYMAFIIQN